MQEVLLHSGVHRRLENQQKKSPSRLAGEKYSAVSASVASDENEQRSLSQGEHRFQDDDSGPPAAASFPNEDNRPEKMETTRCSLIHFDQS